MPHLFLHNMIEISKYATRSRRAPIDIWATNTLTGKKMRIQIRRRHGAFYSVVYPLDKPIQEAILSVTCRDKRDFVLTLGTSLFYKYYRIHSEVECDIRITPQVRQVAMWFGNMFKRIDFIAYTSASRGHKRPEPRAKKDLYDTHADFLKTVGLNLDDRDGLMD